MLGRHAAGATADELRRRGRSSRRLLAGEAVAPVWPELAMFAPVGAVKSRHECVLLPFEAAGAALAEAGG